MMAFTQAAHLPAFELYEPAKRTERIYSLSAGYSREEKTNLKFVTTDLIENGLKEVGFGLIGDNP